MSILYGIFFTSITMQSDNFFWYLLHWFLVLVYCFG